MSGAGRHEPALQALLERGGAPNLPPPRGVTPPDVCGRRRGGLLLPCRGDPTTRSPKVPRPWHVTASWGCHRPLLLKKGGDVEPRDQVSGDSCGEGDSPFGGAACAGTLIIEGVALVAPWWPWQPRGGPGSGGSSVPLPAGWERSRRAGAGANPVGLGLAPPEEPGGGRRSLSFLTEDGTEDGPLSSTRRSLLEELELGGASGAPPSFSIPSLTPWPPLAPGGSTLPPQPLASSTLLWAGDELGEGPQSRILGGRSTRGPPRVLPKPQQEFGAGGSLRPPRCCSRVPGGHGVAPRAPQFHGFSVSHRSSGDGDVPRAVARDHPGVPRGPPLGWARPVNVPPAVPEVGVTVFEEGAGGCDRSHLGDSSGGSESFVTAVEILEPSEAGGSPGAQHRCSPQPGAAGGPTRAASEELPPTSPPNTERVQGEDSGGGSKAAPGCEEGSEVGDVGELLARLWGCSLRGSPPRTPEAPRSPASVTAGDVTPQGTDPPIHRHVTPRTKSRLQASAARLGASSSSSSLFDESLEMPWRPPRLRVPRGVPRDPATPGRGDVSNEDREGTGSLDDTEILPGAPSLPPGASSSPSSSPTVLLVPGDCSHPQDGPSHGQGSSGSSPTVLLVPGDRGHPQDTPSDAQGSSGSSPTVLLVPGDHGHPQDTPSDAQSSLCATSSPNPRVLEGVSGWQNPSTLGTHQSRWPHGSSSHLPAPRPPGSTAVEPRSPVVAFSPAACSEEHLEDEERGQAPTRCHSPGTEATTSPEDAVVQDGRARRGPPRPLSDEALRRRLRALGDNPGPVTELTRRLYLRRLEELVRGPRGSPAGHSPELVAALRTGHVPDCAQDELVLAKQFDRPDRTRHWREGLVKSSFNYLLLDPRTTQNLPLRSHRLSPTECFRTFVEAIFYVGKGTRARPYCHLTEALSQHRAGTQRGCPKVRRILEIWGSGHGVISMHCFQGTVPAEAYTREGCLVEALGLQTLTNQRKGQCYGVAASWPAERRRRLGVHMLHRAMCIFLAEGERQLRPPDIQGGH